MEAIPQSNCAALCNIATSVNNQKPVLWWRASLLWSTKLLLFLLSFMQLEAQLKMWNMECTAACVKFAAPAGGPPSPDTAECEVQ